MAFTYQGWFNTYSFSSFIFNFLKLLIKNEQMTVTGFFFLLFLLRGLQNQEILLARLSTINTHTRRYVLFASRGKSGGESQQKPGSSKIKTVTCTRGSLLRLAARVAWVRSVPASALALTELKERASLSTWNFLVFVIVSFPLLMWVPTSTN